MHKVKVVYVLSQSVFFVKAVKGLGNPELSFLFVLGE